jgi:SAM-dependent methyltransferase
MPNFDANRARVAEALARAWERRAQSSARDYFVASHEGWSDEALWDLHARLDLRTLFAGFTRENLARKRVLEIGCGVGRLAARLAPVVAEYVGYDIAPSMVAEANKRCSAHANVSFHVGQGDGVPDSIRGSFDVVFAHAVLIHVPRALIAPILHSAFARVVPGGQLRFQVRADPTDDGGFGLHTPDVEAPGPFDVDELPATIRDDVGPLGGSLAPLVASRPDEPDYIGHFFRWQELVDLVADLAPARSTLVRIDRDFAYALAVR